MRTKQASKLAVFEGKRIRKILHEGEWWFSIIDVIEALVGGDRPRKYWNDLKKKLLQEGYEQLSEKIGHLRRKFQATVRPETAETQGGRGLRMVKQRKQWGQGNY